MQIIIGSARMGENGKVTGGRAGDQTGKEVSMQNFYIHKKGWYIVRPKNTNDAKNIAKAMKEICENNNVGYNQDERLGIVNMIKKYGKGLLIKEKTNSDCSSTVRACCIQSGFDPGNFTTGNEVAKLKKTGRFMDAIPYHSGMKLYEGDVLVTCTKGHTVVVVSGYERTESVNANVNNKVNQFREPTKNVTSKAVAKEKRLISYSCKGDDVKWVQQALVNHGYNIGKWGIDGDCGESTVAAIKNFQRDNKLVEDGICGVKTREFLR